MMAHENGITHKESEIETKQLAPGRKKGTAALKAKTEKVKAMVEKINADLLKNPDTARWGLEERAGYIQKQLAAKTITIDGKTYPAKRAFGTIKNWITGT